MGNVMIRKVQRLQGIVVSDKMEKTRTVLVKRTVKHPSFGKIIRMKSKFLIHDEKNVSKVGDIVAAISTRPLSRRKHFKLVEVVRQGVSI